MRGNPFGMAGGAKTASCMHVTDIANNVGARTADISLS